MPERLSEREKTIKRVSLKRKRNSENYAKRQEGEREREREKAWDTDS